MSEHASDGRQSPRKQSTDEKLLDELIFRQDLNEVHLLIDFISGRADRSLLTLAMPDPQRPKKMMTSGEIVEAITKMRYPPDKSQTVNARNAAILLMAKDRLSALANPARGLTIAYTTMFIGAEARTIRGHFRDWGDDRASRKANTAAAPGQSIATEAGNGTHPRADEVISQEPAPGHDTRIDLAVRTFPGLQAHARRFRCWRDGLAYFTVFWLFITALAYWDAGFGRATLERLDQNWKVYFEARKDSPELVDFRQGCDLDGATAKLPSVVPVSAAGNAKSGEFLKVTSELGRSLSACSRLQYLHRMTARSRADTDNIFGCRGMSFHVVWHVWCWHWLLPGSIGYQGPGEAGQANEFPQAISQETEVRCRWDEICWQTATSILAVFTTYVLPMMFALLGTLIGAFRAILNRIRDGELAPRDLIRMKIGIPTGLVAGIAVGLFLSPSSVPVQGAGGVAGQFTLTASGLGFLAGYASQSFLQFLDSLLGTVFPDASASNAKPTSSGAGSAA
jgi:hypothetical protein